MDRQYYLNLAASGLCMPIGTDMVLHEYPDHAAVLADGRRLGQVIAETARRFDTPLALPHMDLELEKHALLGMLGIPHEDIARYHFAAPPDDEQFARLAAGVRGPLPVRLQAHIDSIAYIARETDLLPVGMAIGPFSLMTKLVDDPITPICLAGSGLTAADEEEIAVVERVLEIGTRIILHSLERQIEAGAKAIFIAEPAANKVYLSPNQIDAGSDIFERFVMAYNQRVTALLNEWDVDLIFHCCGELTDYMVRQFAALRPVILSLGSSRILWEDAALVPKDIVLFGNLPSKRFYSDALITAEEVEEAGNALIARMREVGHPFILGSECDILCVPGCEHAIAAKMTAVQRCGCAVGV